MARLQTQPRLLFIDSALLGLFHLVFSLTIAFATLKTVFYFQGLLKISSRQQKKKKKKERNIGMDCG